MKPAVGGASGSTARLVSVTPKRLESAEEIGVLLARHHPDEATEAKPGLECVGAGEHRAEQRQEAVEEAVRDLGAHIERLRPFPEVPEALARLQTRYPLVVLSNGDPDMLETAKHYHGIPFDHVISVAVANAFKPHIATYTKAAEIVGVRMDEVLFIANHVFDCIGAKSAGMRTAFIDRRRRPFGITPHQPDLIVPTMKDLADLLVGNLRTRGATVRLT